MTDLSHNCEQIIPLLDSYHDGEASSDEKTTVESHLGSCADCRKRLGAIGNLVATLKALPEMKMKDDFADRVEQLIIKTDKSTSTGKVIRFGYGAWAATAAAVVVLTLLVTQFVIQHSTVNVASRPEQFDDGRPQTAVNKEMAAADDNAQAPARKEQAGNTDSAKGEKTRVNEQTVPSRKMSSSMKTRIAEETTGKPQGLAVASRPGEQAMGEGKVSQSGEAYEQDNQKQSLVASEPETVNLAEELGITTDEDGLYAIKL